eukprot:scaffold4698_cov115-Isochrysis_galbana.AAC.2
MSSGHSAGSNATPGCRDHPRASRKRPGTKQSSAGRPFGMGWAGWLTGGWEFMRESEELLDDAIGSLACIAKPDPHACTATPSPAPPVAPAAARVPAAHTAPPPSSRPWVRVQCLVSAGWVRL